MSLLQESGNNNSNVTIVAILDILSFLASKESLEKLINNKSNNKNSTVVDQSISRITRLLDSRNSEVRQKVLRIISIVSEKREYKGELGTDNLLLSIISVSNNTACDKSDLDLELSATALFNIVSNLEYKLPSSLSVSDLVCLFTNNHSEQAIKTNLKTIEMLMKESDIYTQQIIKIPDFLLTLNQLNTSHSSIYVKHQARNILKKLPSVVSNIDVKVPLSDENLNVRPLKPSVVISSDNFEVVNERNTLLSELDISCAIMEGDPVFTVTESEKDLLGSGAFGKVYKAVYCGSVVAAKTLFFINQPEIYGIDFVEELIRGFIIEMKILSKLRHKNVLPFYAAVFDKQLRPKWILSEYMPHGSLADIIQKHPEGLPLPNIVKIARDIYQGLIYVHDVMKGIHRDVKPANILISSDGVCKLGDFGLAKLNTGSSTKTIVGTPLYCAPEVFKGKYSSLVDVYSTGVLITELILGNPDSDGVKAIEKIPDMKYIIENSLALDVNKRLPAHLLIQQLPEVDVSSTSTIDLVKGKFKC
eukprot:TRINITY_DN3712_c0_g1_i1.p1 TRINITY_DN3712_c0_g1~~TRINITY_DN3712_c0_g1_i1.p1  ORF type:complete len:532 (-),score=63.27 TRINITY_DN3712_c0_g1_i1:25-1620(-)